MHAAIWLTVHKCNDNFVLFEHLEKLKFFFIHFFKEFKMFFNFNFKSEKNNMIIIVYIVIYIVPLLYRPYVRYL